MNGFKEPKVYIVILHWEKPKEVLDCLKSISQLNYEKFRVIVIDNGSKNNFSEMISRIYPNYRIIRNSSNKGFAGGNNVGMKLALEEGAEYVWLLNDDTVVDKDALKYLIEEGEKNKEVGLLSPIIFYYDNPKDVQYRGSLINWKNMSIVYPKEGDTEISKIYQRGNNVCLWGTALLIKRGLLEKIGFFDEKYFAYWEDSEFSMRALRDGFRNMVCCGAKIYHKTDRDTLATCNHQQYYYYYIFRNRLLLIKEYSRGSSARVNAYRVFLADLLRATGSCWRNHRYHNLEAVLLGAWHGFKGIDGPMRSKPMVPKYLGALFKFASSGHPFFLSAIIRGDLKEIREMIEGKAEPAFLGK